MSDLWIHVFLLHVDTFEQKWPGRLFTWTQAEDENCWQPVSEAIKFFSIRCNCLQFDCKSNPSAILSRTHNFTYTDGNKPFSRDAKSRQNLYLLLVK